MSQPESPYAPPQSDLTSGGAALPGGSLRSALAFAFDVFARHRLVLLIALLWFPPNLLIEWVSMKNGADLAADVRIASLASLFVHPLCVGVVLAACQLTRAGRASTFSDLLASAKWGRIFAASFVANLLIGLATLALIVPGLILAVRYAFVEIAAAREDLPSAPARARSRELVAGRALPIVRVYVGFLGIGLAAAFVYGAATSALGVPEHFALTALFDTGIDVLHASMFAVLWALYEAALETSPASPTSASALATREGGPS